MGSGWQFGGSSSPLSQPAISVSNHKSVETSGLRVLITDQAVASLSSSPLLALQQHSQVFEEFHLAAEVFGVIFNTPLMLSQNRHDIFLLLSLDVEVLLEGLHLRKESGFWLADVLGLSLDSPLEGLEDIRLHVILMELRFGLLILLETLSHILDDGVLLALHLVDGRIVLFFLDHVHFLIFGHLLSEVSQLLNSWRQQGLLLPHLLFDLLNQSGQLL